jgi:predicted glycosyltransferase involved in capsule biosynthesis
MDKIKVSVVIPYRYSTNERKRNLFYTVRYYKRFLKDCKIIVIEQDTKTDINEISEIVDVHFKLNTDNDHFNRGLLFNVGYNMSQTLYCADYIIFGDADCLIEKKILENIESYYSYFDNYMVLPFKDNMYYMSEQQTEDFINTQDINTGNNEKTKKLDYIVNIRGGVNILSAKNFYNIGGYDQRFKGWGAEDDAFAHKCSALNLKIYRLDAELLHLHHSYSDKDMGHYTNNMNFLGEYFNTADTKKYVDLLGYEHLTKPCKN